MISKRWDSPDHAFPLEAMSVVERGADDFAALPEEGLRVTWIGHSTALIEIDGHRVLTDPIWGDRVAPVAGIGPHDPHRGGASVGAGPAERVLRAGQRADIALFVPRPGESVSMKLHREVVRWWPELPWDSAQEHPVVSSNLPGEIRQRIHAVMGSAP